MNLNTGYEERRARIEMVPLLDVIFLLLSAFIYATLTITASRGLKVDLPRGEGVPAEPRAFVITITRDAELYLESRRVNLAEAVAAAQGREDAKIPVLVNGDREAALGVAVELLSELRKAGVTAVAFQIRKEP